MTRDYYTTLDWSREDLEDVLDLADQIKASPRQPLTQKNLCLLFFNPSLRTRASFEFGMQELGGNVITMDVARQMYGLEVVDGVVMDGSSAEHVKEAANVLAGYSDAIAIRKSELVTSSSSTAAVEQSWDELQKDSLINSFRSHADVPVINMESNLYHPCQALADIMTIRERLGKPDGKRFVLSWAWHPKALPLATPNSAALVAAKFGMDVTIVRPPGFELPAEIMTELEKGEGDLTVTEDIDNGYESADVVYAKSWASLDHFGNWGEESTYRNEFRNWRVTAERMSRSNSAIFMHCLPVRRNVVVDDAVIDSANSVIYQEAENRKHAQKGLLTHLLEDS